MWFVNKGGLDLRDKHRVSKDFMNRRNFHSYIPV